MINAFLLLYYFPISSAAFSESRSEAKRLLFTSKHNEDKWRTAVARLSRGGWLSEASHFFSIKWVCGSWALSLKIASTRKLHYSKKWRSALGSAGPAFSHYDVISARLQGAWRHSLPGVTLSAQLCKPFFQREVLYSVHCTVSKYTLQEYTTSCYWFTGHRGEYNIN